MSSSSSAGAPFANEQTGAVGGTKDALEPEAEKGRASSSGEVGALEPEAEKVAVSILQRFAVFAMTFGPGAAVATYTCLFGWYQQYYQNSEITVWMRLALFGPFLFVIVLQQCYDTYFDEVYSTEFMYLFRIVIMQAVVSVLMFIWILLPADTAAEEFHPIVIFGMLLGACCAPFIGSSIQMAVAMDPALFTWAQLGNTVGMTVPVVASAAFKFSPASTHADMRRMLVVPLVICTMTSVMLASLHYSGVFKHAYNTITRRRSMLFSNMPEPGPEATTNPQDDAPEEAHPLPTQAAQQEQSLLGQDRQVSDADADVVGQEFPLWIKLWLGMLSSGIMLDFFLLTLIGYFGDADLTHNLASAALASSAIGRLLTLPFPYIPAFKLGPMHKTSAIMFLFRVGLWVPLILQVCKVLHMSKDLLMVVWCSFVLVCMMHNSLTELTVTQHVSESKRQSVAQISVTLSYSAVFIGLSAASSWVLGFQGGNPSGTVSVSLLSTQMAHPISFAGLLAESLPF